MNIAKLSVNNPVTANTSMLAIILLGIFSLTSLPREFLPDVNFNMVMIITAYPGTSPEEMEKLITKPIEDDIKDVNKIDFISSKSSEGLSTIFIKFEDMSDNEFKIILQDIRSAVDNVSDIPEDAEDTTVMDMATGDMMPVLQITVAGDLPEKDLNDYVEKLKDRIIEYSDIGKVEFTGVREREIWVNINPDKINAYGYTIDQVSAALGATNLNLPGGTLDVENSEFLVRTIGEYQDVKSINDVIIKTDSKGRHVKISHVAHIMDTFEDASTLSAFNGRPGATINVSKKKSGNTIEIVERLKKLTKEFEKNELPEGCTILTSNDSSIQIKDAIGKLSLNAVLGMVFVVTILCIFIGWKNAIFATIGIPVSLLCTFIFLQMAGLTLNTSSLFGLMMVIGIIVDDAIVIIENCYRYMNRGMTPKEAAIKGTNEVVAPVFTACLTTIAAFLPLMLLPGIMGKFMRVVPMVVCLALLASLFEAFFILPAHIADWSGKVKKSKTRDRLITYLRSKYTGILTFVLKLRYAFVAGALAMFISFVSFIVFGLINVDLFTMEEISQFYINVKLPEGTNLETTNTVLTEVEKKLKKLPENEIESIVRNAGMLITDQEWIFNTASGHIMVDLVERNDRDRSIDEIIAFCREITTDIPGPLSIEFRKLRAGPPNPKDIEVKVQGKYLEDLKTISEELKTYITKIPGVYGLQNDLEFGKKDLKIRVNEEKAALYGFDVFKIASSIRNAYNGKIATVFRDGDEEIDVIVKYDPDKVQTIDDIKSLKIPTPDGDLVPISNVADITLESGYTKIRHYKLDRAATLSADVDKKINTPFEVNQQLEKYAREFIKKYPGYSLRFEGIFKEIKDQFSSIGQLFILGIFLIYMILGAQFKSYIQPFIILFAVPFTFIGAVSSLIITGQPFSLVVLYGFIGLAGIAVNDSIVMLTFINNARASGRGRWQSIIQAGRLRLRPIILTSITTMFGVFPMAMGLGGKSEIWAPMASTIFWGLAGATLLTLLLMPCIYTIVIDDIPLFFKRKNKNA